MENSKFKITVIIVGLLMIVGTIWLFIASFFVGCGMSPNFTICFLIPLLCIIFLVSGIGLILFKNWARILSIIFFLICIISQLGVVFSRYKDFIEIGVIRISLIILLSVIIYGLPVYILSHKKIKHLFN
jgi:hypothetical protein